MKLKINKAERKFYEVLFMTLLNGIENIAKEINVTVHINRMRVHHSVSEGIITLSPQLWLTYGEISMVIWKAKATRTLTLKTFDTVMSEALYAEVYADLQRFVLHTNMFNYLSGKLQEAIIVDSDLQMEQELQHTPRFRQEKIQKIREQVKDVFAENE